jgi:hypothetical protein
MKKYLLLLSLVTFTQSLTNAQEVNDSLDVSQGISDTLYVSADETPYVF